MAPYSARNPIPNVKQFTEELQRRLDLRKVDLGGESDADKSRRDRAAAKTRRQVIDPTTKSNVIIQDIRGDFEQSVRRPEVTIPLANIDPAQTAPPVPNEIEGADMPTVARGSGEAYRKVLDDLAPPEANTTATKMLRQHDRRTMTIYHPLPIADLVDAFDLLETAINRLSMAVIVGTIAFNWLFVRRGWKCILLSFMVGCAISVALHYWLRKIQQDTNEQNWESERLRAKAALDSLVPESVAWLNNMIEVVWKLIDPEMFTPAADQLEDVMQASVPPSLVENVKVASIGQGDNPFRILSLRSLPDAEQGENKLSVRHSQEEIRDRQQERDLEDDPDSKYYTLEASFAYHALPAKGMAAKARNLHLEIVFYLGVRGLFGVPLPIFAELKGIVGTIRLRFQITSNPPFIKNLTFTFMGLPQLSVSAVPMTKRGLNVLNLPLIGGFVNNSIAAAMDEYVAPKSLSMDIGKLLEGDAIKKETDALGVLYINIHDAEGIEAQDRGGGSDTYVTIAYSQFGRPMYCTRVITKDLHPAWEEDVAIPVYQEQVIRGEKLSIQLWDSDRVSSDDMVGCIEFDLHDIMANPDKMEQRHDRLLSIKDENKEVPGVLNWDVGYYPRAEFKKSMKTTGEDASLPKSIRGREEFQDPQGVIDTEAEGLALTVPPDPTLPSGMLSVIVQQIDNLELERPKGVFGKTRPYAPAQISGENMDEEGSHLPSSYCTLILNDELVFKTRTKVSSSTPYFNAETERFIRDWRNTVVTIAVRDQRQREHDALIGVVVLKLSEVFQTSSQVTRTYALDGGVGYGKITISMLFRSVSLQLAKPLLGWNVGSVELMKSEIKVVGDKRLASTRLVLKTDNGRAVVHRRWAQGEGVWNVKGRIRLPVRQRYMSTFYLKFYSRSNRKPIGHAVLWLRSIIDNLDHDLEIPVWEIKDRRSIVENNVTDSDITKRDETAKKIGILHICIRFKDGMDETHRAYVRTNDDRETMDAFEASLAEGNRSSLVKRETSATVRQLVSDGSVGNGSNSSSAESDEDDEDEVVHKPRGINIGLQSQTERRELVPDEEDQRKAAEMEAEIQGVVDEDQIGSDLDEIAGADPDDTQALEDSEAANDPRSKKQQDKEMKRQEKRHLYRKQRGLMNIKPIRNAMFLKDEIKVGVNLLTSKLALKGRTPDVETEISK